LDGESSCQKEIEDRADRMVQRAQSRRRGRKRDDDENSSMLEKKRRKVLSMDMENPFFPGKSFMNGDYTTTYEKQIMNLLMTSEDFQQKGF
jgi:hypothetical protein